MRRLRDVATLNPTVSGLRPHDVGREVSFLPLEKIWADARFDASQTLEFVGDVRSYNPVGEGDIVMPKVSPTFAHGRVAIARGLLEGRGLATSEVFVIRPKIAGDAPFLRYRLLAADVRSEGMASWTGVAGLKRVSARFVRNVRLDDRAWERRRVIADVLDCECARIGDLLTAKRAQVERVDEYQRAWLDESLSASYSCVTRLRDLLAAPPRYGVLVPRFTDADGVPFIRVNDLMHLAQGASTLVMIERPQSVEYRRTVVEPGDVLVSVVGSVDKAAVVPAALRGANVARAVARLRPLAAMPSELLWAACRSRRYLDQARWATSADTAQPTLNMGDLARFRLVVPRELELRQQLARRISEGLRQIALVICEINRSEAALREYRDALITEAVTGKLDVRKVSEQQLDQSAHAAMEGERPEVLSA